MTADNRKNAAYWRRRFQEIARQTNLTGADSLRYISGQYQRTARNLEAQISIWYQRLAKNNGVSMHEAKQLLSRKELAEFQWTVRDYIRYGEENALTGQWMKQLENASARWHITRLEALKLQNQAAIEALFGAQQKFLSGALASVYRDSYYHTCYEVQKAFEIGWNIVRVDEKRLKSVLSAPWTLDGKTFSDRLWHNKQKLVAEVQNTLTRGVLTGAAPDKLIADVQRKMNASRANAGRLVMTESAAVSAMGQKAAFWELGVMEFEIVETLDSKTCEICASMDGKHFPMENYEIGVTMPPFHPYCRGCTCPYFNDEFTKGGARIARAEDGTQYYVPADTTYEQWKSSFVDGETSNFEKIEVRNGLQAPARHSTITRMEEQDVTSEYLKAATPGEGTITYDDGYNTQQHQLEVDFSYWIHNTFGGEIRLLKEINEQKVKTADYRWRGKLWDLKTVTTEKAANAAVRHGLQQIRENPGGIFLDYRGVVVDMDMLKDVLKKRMQWRKDASAVDIMIILDDGTQVWRYK